MIAAPLAAQAASLIQSLAGKHRADSHGPTSAGEDFGAQIEALLPGAGKTLGDLGTLGQDLLGRLGIGKGAASAATTQPAAAAQAYATTAALP